VFEVLIQTDPFRDLDTLFSRFAGRQTNSAGVMPMDAFRRGSDVWVHIDLPGVKAENLEITVERNVLTIAAERNWQRQDGDQPYFGERYRGNFRRQIQLGDGLDLENLEADLHDGVLTVRIPVAEQAKPRKVQVSQSTANNSPEAIETTTSSSD
jgi:HSP20 family protein